MLTIPSKLRTPLVLTAIYAALWLVALADWLWVRSLENSFPDSYQWIQGLFFTIGMAIGGAWLLWAIWPVRRSNLEIALAGSVAYVFAWQWSVFVSDALAWDVLCATLAQIGLGGLFLLGLGWVIWWVEVSSQYYEAQRLARRRAVAEEDGLAVSVHRDEVSGDEARVWNPLDPYCWAYGRHGRKLNQSVTALMAYSTLFLAVMIACSQFSGCEEIYEIPAGGGEQKQIAQQVKVQKVIRKKFVINPFSAIKFDVPPIEDIPLQLQEITQHAYTVGYGEGAGAGFAGGTNKGKVRFIRLEYSGGDWNQDFGVGADLNMLIEYNIRTKQKVEDKTESRTVAQLHNFPLGKSPPVVYMTGQQSISLSKNEVKVLREYLLEKHGMLFGDNGGSAHFHNQFIAMMRDVLPNVRPVKVPLDDVIHQIPYPIPFLPYVAPHGGKDALGWKLDGRWVCYYHPGDIADAWSDGHSGVPPRITEYCYQLGTNVIFYGHAEYAKWLAAQRKEK